ncbi:MAG TPA: ABC transporter permease [Bryobacteraceae bacterium]|jgi:ribose transport system permease protein|nr:ABC transporter permease [Bryobacteraceae bacterium]
MTQRLQRLLPFLTLIVLFIALTIATPHFLTAINLASVARQTAVINIMALGMTLVIITGGIDLSVGSILAIAGLFGTMAIKDGYPIPIAIIIGIATGLLCGFLNGLMITQLRINAFIVTLGTLEAYRGLALVVSKGLPVHEIPDSFSFLGDGNLLGIPFSLWLLALCALLMHFVLEHTKLGRYAFAIGSNSAAAYYAGVPIKFHLTAVYAIAGMLAGLAGMIEASRLMTGQPTAGQGYELQAIAAVVIGGGSLQGGEGSVMGTLIGAFIIGLLSNGSDLLGVNPYWQQVIIGAVIIVAVAFDELRKRKLSTA